MMSFKHFDEARRDSIAAMKSLLDTEPALERAVIIQDLFGKIRLLVWLKVGADAVELKASIEGPLREAGASLWTGTIWIAGSETTESDRIVYEGAWDEGAELTQRLRLDDRHRNRTAWFTRFRAPLWSTRGHAFGEKQGPPIVLFASFKGGLGRTTTLAAFAIQRARKGERVAVIDFDLDAPGVGTLLAADEAGTTAAWGVVDYLLERPHGEVPLGDYTHRCAREPVTGEGVIFVIPAGRLDREFLTKLSRVDLEVYTPDQVHPLGLLLDQVRAELDPHWILVDSRAGFSPAAGLLLSGFGHLHVLFGTTNEQSLRGIEWLVHHLGAARPSEDPQADCLVVQAMVPDNTITGTAAEKDFKSRIEEIFTEHYLVSEESDPDDRFWSVRDLDNSAAPHVPIPIPYREKLTFFSSIEQIADDLATAKPYCDVGSRIESCFPVPAKVTEKDET